MSETYTEEEVGRMIEEVRESYNVREVVCEKTGRRWPMLNWVYATGIVTIDTTKGDERVHSHITAGEYEQLCEAIAMLGSHKGTLAWTVADTGEYLDPRKFHFDLMNAIDTLRTLKLTLQGREQEAQEGGQ